VRMYPRIRGRASDKCFPDGSFIAAPASDQLPAAAASEKLGPDEQYLVRVKASGEKIADLGKFPVPDYKSDIIREVSIEHTADRIYVGDAKTFEVREQTLDGRLLRILRVAYTPKPVPSNAQPDFVCVEGCATNAPPTALPKTYPVYGRVRADVARRIWIQSYEPRNSWLVFDSTFAFKGILSLPRDDKGSPTEELVGMEKDHVVILRYDKDGAPILAFHRIVHR
jgi:hypothetical protein